MKHYLILLAGIVGAASSVFFIKESSLAPASLSAVRLLLSSLILAPFAFAQLHKHPSPSVTLPMRSLFLAALPATPALAVHYTTWFVGVRETSAAMSTLIVNMTPVFMPFCVFVLMRERITRGELLGSLIAIAGIVVLVLGKDASGQTTLAGSLTCIGSIGLCTLYLALGRRFGRGRQIFVYIVPLYLMAGLMSLLFAFALRESLPPLTRHEVLVALGAVLFPTVIGHTALNYAMAHLRAQVVSISCLGQFVVVAILAVPIRHEYPGSNLVLPAVLVIVGALIVIRAATPRVADRIKLATTEPAGT